MAASNTYIIKSVTFKSTTIDGVESVDFGNTGDVVTHNSDGQVAIMATFVDNLRGTCTVTSRNTGLGATANFAIGQTGSLVIVMQKRAEGVGAASGSDKTLTAATATVTSNAGTAPHADRGTLTLEFSCSDPANGVSPWAWS